MKTPITRRTVLRGLGTAVALPFLESLAPAQTAARAAAAAPKRLAFVYVPTYTRTNAGVAALAKLASSIDVVNTSDAMSRVFVR